MRKKYKLPVAPIDFLKLINNSERENKGNHYRDGGLETGS